MRTVRREAEHFAAEEFAVLEVLAAGPLATIQDRGRVGYAHLGVPRSGALDLEALELANRLVGNESGNGHGGETPAAAEAAGDERAVGVRVDRTPAVGVPAGQKPVSVERAAGGSPERRPAAGELAVAEGAAGRPAARRGAGLAGIEVAWGGFSARVSSPTVMAVTGAPVPVWADGRPAGFGVPVFVQRELRIGGPTQGTYSYVAVRGGIDAPLTLGSRSTDTLSGLGPKPLRPGDRLRLGPPVGEPGTVDFTPAVGQGGTIRVRVRFGPRDGWFSDPLQLHDSYQVTGGNRIGVRLTGPLLERAREGELASEGLVAGAIQVPGNGQPIVFLADHPTTGGYPVIAVVHPDDLASIAQARPGSRVVFCGP